MTPPAGSCGSLQAGPDEPAAKTTKERKTNTIQNFCEYSVGVSESPEYYGDVTLERASNIADDLTRLIESEFPGIAVKRDESPVRGPDEETCYSINSWIQANWTAAL